MNVDEARSETLPWSEHRDLTVRRRIKFESELDRGFGAKIAALAHGEQLFSCIQCGTCSATCPVSHFMDYTPRRIIAMVREGFREEVLKSLTIWLCASCYSCTVDCPREIKITDVMYALKREAITAGVYPKRLPTPVLAREFFKGVEKRGRNSESRLMMALYLRTNPFRALKDAFLGLRLMKTGRLPLAAESIRDVEGLGKLLAAVDKAKGEAKA